MKEQSNQSNNKDRFLDHKRIYFLLNLFYLNGYCFIWSHCAMMN